MVKILNIGSVMCGKTVKTQIILLLQKQSDLGLYCLPFQLYFLVYITAPIVNQNFMTILSIIVDVQIDRLLTEIKEIMIRILEISIFISCYYIKFREMLS